MKKLYCPKCFEYLENSSGELTDCICGWAQPVEPQPAELKTEEEIRAKIASAHLWLTPAAPTLEGDDRIHMEGRLAALQWVLGEFD